MDYYKLNFEFFKLGVITTAAIIAFLSLASAFTNGELNIAYMFIIFPFCILLSVSFIASFVFGMLALRNGDRNKKVITILGTELLLFIGFVFWLGYSI